MILIVTNRLDQTADFLILELKKRQADYIRFNTEDFPRNIALTWKIDNNAVEGYFTFPKRKLMFNEIKSIWYRRPVSPILDDKFFDSETRNFIIEESRTTLEGLWRTIKCFWVSNPDNIKVAENKMYQLEIASSLGLSIYPTTVTNDSDFAKEFYKLQNNDVVYKPLKKGRITRGERQSFIFTNPISDKHMKEISKIKNAPSLLQRYIHKNSELRITVIGNKVFAVEIDSQKIQEAAHDWRRALHSHILHKPFSLPLDLQEKCILLTKRLGLEFGALDFILTPNGDFIFLEINPNGQWAWIQQLCPDIHLKEALADLLINQQ